MRKMILIVAAVVMMTACSSVPEPAPAPAPEPEPVQEPAPPQTFNDALRGAAGGLLRAGADEAARRLEDRGETCDFSVSGTPAEYWSLEDWEVARLDEARGLLQGCIAAGRFEFASTLAAVSDELRRRGGQ